MIERLWNGSGRRLNLPRRYHRCRVCSPMVRSESGVMWRWVWCLSIGVWYGTGLRHLVLLRGYGRLKHVLSWLSIWHSVRAKLLVVGVVRHLFNCTTHCHLVCQICSQSTVEVGRSSLQVSSEAPVLHREIVVLFFVHLLIDDILLRYP